MTTLFIIRVLTTPNTGLFSLSLRHKVWPIDGKPHLFTSRRAAERRAADRALRHYSVDEIVPKGSQP